MKRSGNFQKAPRTIGLQMKITVESSNLDERIEDRKYIIELQGKIKTTTLSSDLRIGELLYNPPRLYIGNHILQGKIETMKKPLVLMEKNADGLKVLQVIREKIVFNNRPEHIVWQKMESNKLEL